MSSDFKIFINSQNGTLAQRSREFNSANPTGFKNSFLSYNYDFSTKEDGLYEVTFTFVSNSGNYIYGCPVAFLNIDFGIPHSFTANNGNADSSSQCFGILYPKLDYIVQK